jgi:hypothetical protein
MCIYVPHIMIIIDPNPTFLTLVPLTHIPLTPIPLTLIP